MNNKKIKPIIIWIIAVAVIVAAIFSVFIISNNSTKVSKEFTLSETQSLIDKTFENLPAVSAYCADYIADNTKITVKSVSYGNEKNVIAECEYKTVDAEKCFDENENVIMAEGYRVYRSIKESGKMANATKIAQSMKDKLESIFKTAPEKKGKVTLNIYEVAGGDFKLYLSDEIVNECMGGIIAVTKKIDQIKSVTIDGTEYDLKNITTLRTGVATGFKIDNYVSEKPVVGNFITKWWNDFSDEFYRNFIKNSQWKFLTGGLLTTLEITGLSALLGIFIGFLIAIVRCTYETTGKLSMLNGFCKVYLTVFRGTPVMIQLLILFFVFLLPAGIEKFPSAVICFGLNSGAYVAEIVRGGIMSIDKGQNEAGRSLGLNFVQTMVYIVTPQAFKAVLPALLNEFIALLKESSIAFYIGVADLTEGGLKIRSITYSNFMPLIAVALIYLILVIILTKLVGILERRLRKSDH